MSHSDELEARFRAMQVTDVSFGLRFVLRSSLVYSSSRITFISFRLFLGHPLFIALSFVTHNYQRGSQ